MNPTMQAFLTKHEIDTDYEIDDQDIIRSPGKFEAEHVAILYFYDAYMNGDTGVDWDAPEDDNTLVFEVTNDERKALDLPNRYVLLFFSEQGFVYLHHSDEPRPWCSEAQPFEDLKGDCIN